MALPIKRFTSKTDDFNLAITGIASSQPSTIENSGSNSNKDISKDLKELVDTSKENLNTPELKKIYSNAKEDLKKTNGWNKIKNVKSKEDFIRETKSLSKSLTAISEATENDINKYLSNLFGDDTTLAGLYKKLSAQCRGKGLSNSSSGKPRGNRGNNGDFPFDLEGAAECAYEVISEILDHVSDGQFQDFMDKYDDEIKKYVTVGTLGYDAGVTNVMSAIKVSNQNPKVLGRVSSILIEDQATKGNFIAVDDIIINTNGEESPGVQVPDLLNKIFTNIKTPTLAKEEHGAFLFERIMNIADKINPNWSYSEYSPNELSIRFIDSPNSLLKNSAESRLGLNTFDEDSLMTSYFSTTDDIIASCMSTASDGVFWRTKNAIDCGCSQH